MGTYRKRGRYYTSTGYSEEFDGYSEVSPEQPEYAAYQEEAADYQPEYAAYQEEAADYQPEYYQEQYEDYGAEYQDARQTAVYDNYSPQSYRYHDYSSQQLRQPRWHADYSDRQRASAYPYPRYGRVQETQEVPEQEEGNHERAARRPEPDGEELQRRREARRHRRIREEKRRRRRKRLIIALSVRLACMLTALFIVISLFRLLFFGNPVRRKVRVEAGTELDVKDFLKKEKVKGEFVTDISKVRLDHVGEQEIVLEVKGKKRKSRLIVEDTKAPKADPVPAVIDVDGKLKAKELVDNIEDATDVKCSFKKKPDLSEKGSTSAVVILTDEGGNTAEVEADIEVIIDKEAPVIDGVAPLTGFIGEPISYKSTITVTDNCVRDMDVTVDNSKVDTKTAGTYDVFYTAVDRAGNKAEASTVITIKEKPQNYVTPEEVLEEADEVLKEITKKGMTKKEKAKAIYEWARMNIGYVNKSEKDSWTNGAHQGFTEKSGDCFVFFATAKALLTQAGVPNLDVVKSDTSHSSHYWSLIDCGDGWYHFDATPRMGGGDDFFMKTDAQILKYSKNHRNSHIFDQSLYPATPTEESTVK